MLRCTSISFNSKNFFPRSPSARPLSYSPTLAVTLHCGPGNALANSYYRALHRTPQLSIPLHKRGLYWDFSPPLSRRVHVLLSLSLIAELFRYCNEIGCGEVAIDLKDFLPQVKLEDRSVFSQLVPSNGSLWKINISVPDLREREWSYLFDRLTVPNLEVLEIVGLPHPLDLVKFLSRHQKVACLRLNSQQMRSIALTELAKFGLLDLDDIRGPAGSVTAILGSLSQAADICRVNVDCVHGTLYDLHASRICNSLISLDSLIKLELHIYPGFQSRLRYLEP